MVSNGSSSDSNMELYDTILDLAESNSRRELYDKAIVTLERARKIRCTDDLVALRLARLYVRVGRARDACDLLGELQLEERFTTERERTLGAALLQLSENDRAVAILERAYTAETVVGKSPTFETTYLFLQALLANVTLENRFKGFNLVKKLRDMIPDQEIPVHHQRLSGRGTAFYTAGNDMPPLLASEGLHFKRVNRVFLATYEAQNLNILDTMKSQGTLTTALGDPVPLSFPCFTEPLFGDDDTAELVNPYVRGVPLGDVIESMKDTPGSSSRMGERFAVAIHILTLMEAVQDAGEKNFTHLESVRDADPKMLNFMYRGSLCEKREFADWNSGIALSNLGSLRDILGLDIKDTDVDSLQKAWELSIGGVLQRAEKIWTGWYSDLGYPANLIIPGADEKTFKTVFGENPVFVDAGKYFRGRTLTTEVAALLEREIFGLSNAYVTAGSKYWAGLRIVRHELLGSKNEEFKDCLRNFSRTAQEFDPKRLRARDGFVSRVGYAMRDAGLYVSPRQSSKILLDSNTSSFVEVELAGRVQQGIVVLGELARELSAKKDSDVERVRKLKADITDRARRTYTSIKAQKNSDLKRLLLRGQRFNIDWLALKKV